MLKVTQSTRVTMDSRPARYCCFPQPHHEARASFTCCSSLAISSCNGVSGLVISGGRCRHKAPNKRHGDRLLEGAASRDRQRERELPAQSLSSRRQTLATPNKVRPAGAAIFLSSHKVPRFPAGPQPTPRSHEATRAGEAAGLPGRTNPCNWEK